LWLFDTFLRCVNTCNNVYYIYKTEWILEGSSNCCLNFVLQYNSKYLIGILPMAFWLPYSWYFDHPFAWYIEPTTHGILTPLPMVSWSLYIFDFDSLPMVYRPPTHRISTLYPWYFESSIHGILTPLPMEYRPPTHGIRTPLPMVFWPRILTPIPRFALRDKVTLRLLKLPF
jgi:hypothetical protein